VPRANSRDCQERIRRWGNDRVHREVDYASAQSRIGLSKDEHPAKYTYDQIRHLKLIPGKRLRGPHVQLETERLRAEFNTLAQQWRRETQHLSLISKKVVHPAYLRIIGMGKPAIRLLLEELRDRPSHWFVALKFVANVDPVPHGGNPSRARDAWLEWGRSEGFLP
jgi:hypothetical protein